MSRVTVTWKCPQCGHPHALSEFNCRDRSRENIFFRCGYEESDGPVLDADHQVKGWKIESKYGAGAMRHGEVPGGSSVMYCLHENQEIADAEAWLREQIASKMLAETACYLKRYNEKTEQVEMVVGSFIEV